MGNFFEELKRRNVIKATIAYVVIGWILLQVTSIVLPIVNAPDWVLKTFSFFIALGFPIWVFISWVYEITPEGLKKTVKISKDQSITATTNKRLNVLILVGLVAAIVIALMRPTISISESSSNNPQYAIAVLPFEDLTAEGDSEWFCIGVTEDILTHLSKIKSLTVISRTSVMQYKNHGKTIPEIAKELGVTYLVEGSVRKQGNKVLVTAQLINADDKHLWADNYNEDLDDVFKIQQEISKKIVQQLKIVISPEDEELLSNSSTTSVEAYQLFLRGRTIADKRTKKDLEKSIEFYEQAIEIDPNYADAYAEIANSTHLLINYGDIPENESIKKSKNYINKALAINPNTVRAYTVLGMVFQNEKDWGKSKESFEKANTINPNDATEHHHFAIYYRDNPLPDYKKMLYHINLAQQLDPLSYPINAVKITALIYNEKLDEAEAHLNKMSFVIPYNVIVSLRCIINSIKNKDLTEYIKVYTIALEKEPKNADLHIYLSYYYISVFNDYDNALKHARRAFELDSTSSGIASSLIYSLYYSEQFKAAKALLNNPKVFDLFDEITKIVLTQDYHAYKGDYNMAITSIDQLKVLDSIEYYDQKIWLYSKKGDAEIVQSVIDKMNTEPSDYIKAVSFAFLKKEDSMYYYINKIAKQKNIFFQNQSVLSLNRSTAFNPYRKDPKYIAFLKDNYFPVLKE